MAEFDDGMTETVLPSSQLVEADVLIVGSGRPAPRRRCSCRPWGSTTS